MVKVPPDAQGQPFEVTIPADSGFGDQAIAWEREGKEGSRQGREVGSGGRETGEGWRTGREGVRKAKSGEFESM